MWGVIILQVLHLALLHGRVSPSGSSSRMSSLYKKIPQTLGSSAGHGRSFCKDLSLKVLEDSMMGHYLLNIALTFGKSG